MFSVNFAKFLRTHFIKKTAGTLEKHKDLQRAKPHIILLKEYAIPLKAPETSLQIYKNNHFTSCTQKTAIAIATNMKTKQNKTYFAVLQVGEIRN